MKSKSNHRLVMTIPPEARSVRLAREVKPEWVCLTPKEVLSKKSQKTLHRLIESLQFIGIEVSLRVQPKIRNVEAVYHLGADAVEFDLKKWASQRGKNKKTEWKQIRQAADLAKLLSLELHLMKDFKLIKSAQLNHIPGVTADHLNLSVLIEKE